MIKSGDLVMLADDKWVVPGALTALKYYQRLRDKYGGKPMIVLEVRDKPKTQHVRSESVTGLDKSIVVMVEGHKQVFTSSLLKVVNEPG